ncbi:hypothetical protein O1611_g5161 [Lasiodiplodia mahajangana]|uniref:Uncharacterized protein n=1 Tax=Lasiodiplodia mahajangana TaxID=1108764 RepID=A0ACC2JMI7_9PEZI|nr:hypothetical protein O1611_g5161 [Lasiodiplodia mahajangana]
MSQQKPIIYITGGPGCGITDFGKRLAAQFNFYYICLEDCRRTLLEQLHAGVPWLSDDIRQCINENREVTSELYSDYETVPIVIQLYNEIINGTRGWTSSLAIAIIEEEISKMNAEEESDVRYRAIMIDGHPLTAGNVSAEVVARYQDRYAGLIIAISSPAEVAQRRYIDRIKTPSDDEDRFRARIRLVARVLSEFLKNMSGNKIYFEYEKNMTMDEAYHELVVQLREAEVWQRLTKDKTGDKPAKTEDKSA